MSEMNVLSISKVTAGILSFNRKDDLRRTLKAVLEIPGLRVIVIDNASTDGTREMLRDEFGITNLTSEATAPLPAPSRPSPLLSVPPRPSPLLPAPPRPSPPLSALPLPTNEGITARNRFIQLVESDYLLSLDDDSWPRSEEDVLRMVETMESGARIAAVCAACVHPDTGVAETRGIERFASAGSAETGWDVVNIAAGGTLLRMEALRETGGYGEEFFWGREENDLAFQLLQRDWRVVYNPRAVVWHTLSPAGRRQYERLRYVTRNSLWLLWKYFPLVYALPLAALYALRRLLAVVKDVRRLGPVLRGLAEGVGGMSARRRDPHARRFTLAQSRRLGGWFRKLLYE